MKNAILKSFAVLAATVALTGCQIENTNTTNNTTTPVVTEPSEQTFYLIAPNIIIDTNLLLQIIPSTDAKTIVKTTGYEVSINGVVQSLDKTQLSIQLELNSGDDVIEVKAIGGKNTASQNKSTITVTEEQKEAIAYDQLSDILEENLIERLNTMYAMVYGSPAENLEILSIGSNGNDMTFDIRFNQQENSEVIYQHIITATDFLNQDINDVFELNSYVKENISTLGISISNFTSVTIYNTQIGVSYLLNGSYINGQNRTESVSELGEYINNGWEASVIYENRSGINSILGNDFGTTRVNRFTTSALVKLEKNGEEDKYLQVLYNIYAHSQYSAEELMAKLADGTLPASDIKFENEIIVDKGNLCGIYLDAKTQYEGKDIVMNEPTIINLKSAQSVANVTKTKHFYIPDLELEL